MRFFEFFYVASFSVKFNVHYSIVKDSSADLGVNSKIVQIRLSAPKFKKKFFLHIRQYFDISERK